MTHTRAQTDRQAWKSSTPGDAVPLSQDEHDGRRSGLHVCP